MCRRPVAAVMLLYIAWGALRRRTYGSKHEFTFTTLFTAFVGLLAVWGAYSIGHARHGFLTDHATARNLTALGLTFLVWIAYRKRNWREIRPLESTCQRGQRPSHSPSMGPRSGPTRSTFSSSQRLGAHERSTPRIGRRCPPVHPIGPRRRGQCAARHVARSEHIRFQKASRRCRADSGTCPDLGGGHSPSVRGIRFCWPCLTRERSLARIAAAPTRTPSTTSSSGSGDIPEYRGRRRALAECG